MKKIFSNLFVLILCIPQLLTAQAVNKIELKPLLASDVRLKLVANSVSKIEVQLQLKDTTKLGFSIVNDEETITLQPDKSWQEWMNGFVQASIGSQLNPSTTSRLLLIVKDIRLQKNSQGMSALRFSGEAWKAEELADAYNAISRVDTVIVGKGEISEYLTGILLSLLNPASPPAQKTYLSIPRAQAISMSRELTSTPAVLKNREMNDGLYRSFEEFTSNSPSTKKILAFPDSIHSDRLRVFELLPDSSKREVPSFWGICMNDELYVLNNGVLVPFEESGPDFLLSVFVDPRERRNQGRFRMLLGSKNQPPLHNTSTKCTSFEIQASRIDMQSGELTF